MIGLGNFCCQTLFTKFRFAELLFSDIPVGLADRIGGPIMIVQSGVAVDLDQEIEKIQSLNFS